MQNLCANTPAFKTTAANIFRQFEAMWNFPAGLIWLPVHHPVSKAPHEALLVAQRRKTLLRFWNPRCSRHPWLGFKATDIHAWVGSSAPSPQLPCLREVRLRIARTTGRVLKPARSRLKALGHDAMEASETLQTYAPGPEWGMWLDPGCSL